MATIRARDAVSSACACAFAIAVATSAVNFASRFSVSGGNGSGRVEAATITPHSRPSMLIGAPTADRMARPGSSAAAALEGSAWLSSLTARPVSKTSAVTFRPPTGALRAETALPARFQPPTPVTVPSVS